jgi:low affinity Fe/Cu permease
MDLLNNSSKYSDYLQRIQEYKEIADSNTDFSIVEGRVDNLYTELKSKDQKKFYTNILKAILFLSLTISFVCFFVSYITLGVLNMITLVSAYVYYRFAIKPLANESQKEQQLLHGSKTFETKLYHTMKYLENGIDLKNARIIAVRFIYIGLFSVLMFTCAKLLNIENATSSFVLYSISLLLNAAFWFYFFKDDLEELEYISMELDEYIASFEKSREEACMVEVEQEKEVIDEVASAQKEIDFYNLEADEPMETVPNPLPAESSNQKEYKQLKLEL